MSRIPFADPTSNWLAQVCSPQAIGLVLACMVLGLSAGCSKEKIQAAIEEAKTQTKSFTESTVEAIEEKLPERGSLTLETSPPTPPTKQLDVELITIGDGRPNVVQIVSYDLRQPGRSFPAIMLQGATAAGTAASLVGQTIECDVYYQASAETPIAITRPGNSLAVTFDTLNDEQTVLNATLGSVDLLRSDEQTVSIQGGRVVAVIRSEK